MQPLAGPHEDRVIEHTLNELRTQIEPQPIRLAGVKTVLGGILVVLVLMVCGGILAVSWQNSRTTGISSTVTDQSARLEQQQAALQSYAIVANKLADQLKQNGIKPSVTPAMAPPLPTVTTQAPPLTNVQIQKALQSCWMAGQCDAKPTPAQLVTAFQTYCSIDGRCRGPAGRNATGVPGPSGSPGATGTGTPGPSGPPGEPGPGPTDTQVATAVTTYCSSGDNCKGYPTAIIIEVPNNPLDPSAVRTETCTPSSTSTDHVYTCQ